MVEYQFKDCYDIDELDLIGITVRFVGHSLEFVHYDKELKENIVLAVGNDYVYGAIKFATSFTFDRRFRALLQDRFAIEPIYKQERHWVYSADGKQSKLVYTKHLIYGDFELTKEEFHDVLYGRLLESLAIYRKKKEILKWKYNMYRKYVFARTPAKQFLKYGPVNPEITVLPNGNEVTIKKINGKYYVVKAFIPVVIGTGPAGDIYDTDITYFIVEHDFKENRNRVLVELSQEKFDMLKEL